MNAASKLNAILVTIAVLGLFLSGSSAWLLHKTEEKSIVSELQRDVDKRAASLYRELVVNFETLQSLAILFRGAKHPEHAQFRNEARNILRRHSDIQALEWIPRIPHSQRNAYVARIRQYYPDYEISERQQQGIMVRAKVRQEYFPVYYIAPLLGNEAALGFDLSSSPSRLAALEESRDTGLPQATASITLVQESAGQKGFLAIQPIYHGRTSTLEQRREALSGFVLGVFRIGDIFTSSALSNNSLGINMLLIEETAPSTAVALYTHTSRTGSPAYGKFTYRKELPDILGRKWALIGSPTVTYAAQRQSVLPLVILVVGTIFTAFIVTYCKMIAQRSATIEHRVIEKTNELSLANQKLEMLSRIDGLTGIANRRQMDEVLDREWLRAIRNGSEIAFVLIDIDFFKTYNDNYGHLMGDNCLKHVATTLKDIPGRPTDLVARYGGEEFALVLAETRSVYVIAEKCRQSIEQLSIRHEFSGAADVVTISIGVCSCKPESGTEPGVIIDTADKALYRAKAKGKNRIEYSELGISGNSIPIRPARHGQAS